MIADSPGMKIQIVTTVIGPGEISSWLYPFVKVLKETAPQTKINVCILPSVFRTGSETAVLENMPDVDSVASMKETKQLIYLGKFPEDFKKGLPGCVLHFGGEPILSRWLASRFNYPVVFYGEETPSIRFLFNKIFLTAEKTSDRRREKIVPLGNLMVDAARMRCSRRIAGKPGSVTVGIFPGSRYYMAKEFLPFFMKVARYVSASIKNIRWTFAKSDYLSIDVIKKIIQTGNEILRDGERACFKMDRTSPFLVSESGVRFDILRPEEVLAQADVALTIPGSNTAELAILGIPMIVMLPTQRVELYPFPGPIGHLNKIPVIGKYIKIALLQQYFKKVKYLALPNKLAQREIVPEIKGKITSEDIAKEFTSYIQKPLQHVSEELRSVMGTEGAARSLVSEILNVVESRFE
jgi:lipid-A-disaccharide synthase